MFYSAQSPYFTVSEKGAVLLADSALDIFGDEDNKELTLIVTAQSGTQLPMLATAAIYFRSQPRAIDGGALTVTIRDFRRGAIVLPSHLVKAKILHAEESYFIFWHHGLFAENYDNGAISLTSGIYAAGEWTVVLRATTGFASVVAEQTIVFKSGGRIISFRDSRGWLDDFDRRECGIGIGGGDDYGRGRRRGAKRRERVLFRAIALLHCFGRRRDAAGGFRA